MWRRSISHGKSLRNLLAQGSRGILVVELGRNLVEELTAVRDVAEHYADVPVIVYGDVDHDLIGGLGYDLGAAAVILPPNGVDELFETLTRFADGSAKK
jgi:DNA-binding NarL/FixJ family response regulator